MKATRWPALVVVPLLLVVMVLADGADPVTPPQPTDTTVVADPGHEPDALPTAASPDASLSTWYCPAGTGGGNEVVDRTVLVVTNTADQPRSVSVDLFGAEGPLGTEELTVPAHTRWQVDLGKLTEAEAAAALVEVDGGGVAVAQVMEGPHGRTVTPCLSEPAGTWYLPSAATTLDARAVLTLFNPFPDDAILDISFVDRDGVRVPTGFEAFPVPPASVVQVDLTDLITVRPQFATAIHAQAGQVVAAMVQEYDGSNEVEGLAVVPGAPLGSDTWYFPSARWGGDARETLVLFNPEDQDAQVDVSVGIDDPATNGGVTPFEVTVPAGSFTVLGSQQDEWRRVPEGVGHSLTVRAVNGVPIVAGLRLTVVGDDRAGVAAALGAPSAARQWILPVVDLGDAVGSVAVLNPNPESLSQATVTGLADGATAPQPTAELAEAARLVVPLGEGFELTTAGALVSSSTPTVVSAAWAFAGGGRAWMVAVPVAGSTDAPDAAPGTTVPES